MPEACRENDSGLKLPPGSCASILPMASATRRLVVAPNGVVYVNTRPAAISAATPVGPMPYGVQPRFSLASTPASVIAVIGRVVRRGNG
jgi:hypothetical protein